MTAEREREKPLTRFRRAGFTIIELMIVTALLGILASIALPKFGNMIDNARESVTKSGITTLRGALAIYYADTEGLYPMYGIPFNLSGGMLELEGKYVDLDRVKLYSTGKSGHGKWTGTALNLFS